jgi:hypothetical protein
MLGPTTRTVGPAADAHRSLKPLHAGRDAFHLGSRSPATTGEGCGVLCGTIGYGGGQGGTRPYLGPGCCVLTFVHLDPSAP